MNSSADFSGILLIGYFFVSIADWTWADGIASISLPPQSRELSILRLVIS